MLEKLQLKIDMLEGLTTRTPPVLTEKGGGGRTKAASADDVERRPGRVVDLQKGDYDSGSGNQGR
jgi:hypothetical protein